MNDEMALLCQLLRVDVARICVSQDLEELERSLEVANFNLSKLAKCRTRELEVLTHDH